MRTTLTVREHARLTTEHVEAPSLDRAQVSPSAFNWLCQTSSTFRASGAALVQVENRQWLRLDNYVGVIETPCSTRIEILPKHLDGPDTAATSRKLLRRMIGAAMDLPVRQVSETALQTFDAPLSEWVMGRFLSALNHLVKRGVRSDYVRVGGAERYLRGQLDPSRHVRQPPGRQHIFQIRHDVFVPDRPENRLLRLALDHVARAAQTSSNWRLAQELRSLLHEVPASTNVDADLRAWRDDRVMAHYRPVHPWCELILYRQMPYSLVGRWHGISLLFPMEKLYERFVAAWLRRHLVPGAILRAPAASEFLCLHEGSRMFRLEPDLLVEHKGRRWVLDTKWKRLDATDRANKYCLSQGDLYQLFAYGMNYLGPGGGDLALVFPRCVRFHDSLPVFEYGYGLRLRVLPFDLDAGVLIDAESVGLPLQHMPASSLNLDTAYPRVANDGSAAQWERLAQSNSP
jgi:5-methylcytosine-specific restriction enzyme subunit McrC